MKKWIYITTFFIIFVQILNAQKVLYTWGNNLYGQLGDGSTNPNYTPTQIGNQTDWETIYAFKYHSAGIKTDGTLWMWGNNSFGQLGLGNNIQQNTPIQIGNDIDWEKVSLGANWTIALKTDGTIWECGQIATNVFTQKGTDNDWVDIDAGNSNLALKSDGTLWSWGYNLNGELGDGTNVGDLNIKQIGSDNDWSKIAMGETAAFAIKTNGTLWGWGNGGGLVGLTAPTSFMPNQIGVATNWAEIDISSGNIAISRQTNGTIWTWGTGIPLGDGSSTTSTSPIQIGVATNWIDVSVSEVHFMAKKSDGTLWAWGNNSSGSIGNGNTTNVLTPIQITNNIDWNLFSGGQFFSIALLNVDLATISLNLNDLTSNSLICYAEITNTGNLVVNSKGIVYSLTDNPTLSNTIEIITNSSLDTSIVELIENLNSNTTYYIRAFVTNILGTVYSNQIEITTLKSGEDYAPNNGDGNGDGILDSKQDYVYSYLDKRSNSFITIVSLDRLEITDVEQISTNSDFSSIYFYFNFLKFKVVADKAVVKIYYYYLDNVKNLFFRKLSPNNEYFNFDNVRFSIESVDNKDVVVATLSLTDGGLGDYDGIVNGEIIDPGAPAILTSNLNIPTLSEWARIILVGFMLLFGGYYAYKRSLT